MSREQESAGVGRREVLKTGALGVGALAGAVGIGAATASEASAVAPASGNSNYFLKLDGIPGDSTSIRHVDEIELDGFAWGLSNTGAVNQGGGGGAGKTMAKALTFSTPTSIASPKLMLTCATGQRLKNALLTVERRGARGERQLTLLLEDVLVASYDIAGSDGDAPIDQGSLVFAKITFTYYPQNRDGSIGAPVVAVYDFKANKGS